MFRWIALGVVLAAIGVAAYTIAVHPPVRLMPSPFLFLSDSDEILAFRNRPDGQNHVNLYYATNRLPVGTGQNQLYTVAPDTRLRLGVAELSIEGEIPSAEQIAVWTWGDPELARPSVHLGRMSEMAVLSKSGDPLAGDVISWISGIEVQAGETGGSVLIYVHGANTTVERAAGQALQLRHFLGGESVVVLFAWPTAENFLKYHSDITSALESAPKVAQLIELLSGQPSMTAIDMFSYSAGATVASRTLSLIAEQEPALLSRIQDVYFAAPDVDFTSFVRDLEQYGEGVGRITASANLGDSALRLAQVVNRASRAGRPDLRELSPKATEVLLSATASDGFDVVHADPSVLPATGRTAHSFWYDDLWVSTDIVAALRLRLSPEDRGLEPARSTAGNRYWQFPAGYPEHFRQMHRKMREDGQAQR